MKPWSLLDCGLHGKNLSELVKPVEVLLSGPSCVGKTQLVFSFAAFKNLPILCVSASTLSRENGGGFHSGIMDAFTAATRVALTGVAGEQGVVLCFDELETLFSREIAISDSLRAFAVSCSRVRAHNTSDSTAKIWVFGTCRSLSSLHPLAQSQFSVREWLSPPPPECRGCMLLAALKSVFSEELTGKEDTLIQVGALHGFGLMAGDFAVLAQKLKSRTYLGSPLPNLVDELTTLMLQHTPLLMSLCIDMPDTSEAGKITKRGRALKEALIRSNHSFNASLVDVDDHRPRGLLKALNDGAILSWGTSRSGSYTYLKLTPPLSLLSSAAPSLSGLAKALRPTSPGVAWDDVKGQEEAKMTLKVLLRNSRASARVPFYSVSPPTDESLSPTRCWGILLHGPPGTGKTLLAKAAASELGARFINLPIPFILRAGLGDSEAALSNAFFLAAQSPPSLIFIDEVQSLFVSRGGVGDDDSSKLAGNLTATLLHCMDTRPAGVFVLAATNIPSSLDPALLRPGRLDRLVFVGLPCAKDRRDIFKAILQGTTLDCRDDFNIENLLAYLVKRSEGFSGADCVSLCRRALSVAVGKCGALDDFLQEVEVCKHASRVEVKTPTLTPDCFELALSGDSVAGLAPFTVPMNLSN